MIWLIPILTITGLGIGRLLVQISNRRAGLVGGWISLTVLSASAHLALLYEDPIIRMVGICTVLLGAIKGFVYAEWANGADKKLPLTRFLIFGLCWFGMDPGTFVKRRPDLSWRNDISLGILLMIVGTTGAWIVWKMEWRQIFVMFLPMSLGFHFGALRVLKGLLRQRGFAVRTLFPNLLKTKGIADFWSRRWNVGYSQMMQRLVGRPVENLAGKTAGMMAVFLVSGILHEIAITLAVKDGYGLPTFYFTVHGLLAVTEVKTGRSAGKIPALLLVLLPIGILFPPAFQREIIVRCLGIFDWLI